MGMFDWVNVPVEIKCPRCNMPLKGWQTKDTVCELITVELKDVYCFYTHCDGCGQWVEYVRKANVETPLADFELKPGRPIPKITAYGIDDNMTELPND